MDKEVSSRSRDLCAVRSLGCPRSATGATALESCGSTRVGGASLRIPTPTTATERGTSATKAHSYTAAEGSFSTTTRAKAPEGSTSAPRSLGNALPSGESLRSFRGRTQDPLMSAFPVQGESPCSGRHAESPAPKSVLQAKMRDAWDPSGATATQPAPSSCSLPSARLPAWTRPQDVEALSRSAAPVENVGHGADPSGTLPPGQSLPPAVRLSAACDTLAAALQAVTSANSGAQTGHSPESTSLRPLPLHCLRQGAEAFRKSDGSSSSHSPRRRVVMPGTLIRPHGEWTPEASTNSGAAQPANSFSFTHSPVEAVSTPPSETRPAICRSLYGSPDHGTERHPSSSPSRSHTPFSAERSEVGQRGSSPRHVANIPPPSVQSPSTSATQADDNSRHFARVPDRPAPMRASSWRMMSPRSHMWIDEPLVSPRPLESGAPPPVVSGIWKPSPRPPARSWMDDLSMVPRPFPEVATSAPSRIPSPSPSTDIGSARTTPRGSPQQARWTGDGRPASIAVPVFAPDPVATAVGPASVSLPTCPRTCDADPEKPRLDLTNLGNIPSREQWDAVLSRSTACGEAHDGTSRRVSKDVSGSTSRTSSASMVFSPRDTVCSVPSGAEAAESRPAAAPQQPDEENEDPSPVTDVLTARCANVCFISSRVLLALAFNGWNQERHMGSQTGRQPGTSHSRKSSPHVSSASSAADVRESSKTMSPRQATPHQGARVKLRTTGASRSGQPSPTRQQASPYRKQAQPSTAAIRQLFYQILPQDELKSLALEVLFDSLLQENVTDVTAVMLGDERSRQRFLQGLRDGSRWSRVRVAWHLAGSVEAAAAIATSGICCDEEHCACGRYGRGGYVALSAAKANAYGSADGDGLRQLFMVLAHPDEHVVQGERGKRPHCTSADLPSHPTEYCFVDPDRLHCVCLFSYRWVSTGRRGKEKTASPTVGHIVNRMRSKSPDLSQRQAALLAPRQVFTSRLNMTDGDAVLRDSRLIGCC